MKLLAWSLIVLVVGTQSYAMKTKDCEKLMNEKEVPQMIGSTHLVQLATGFMEAAVQKTLEQLTHGITNTQTLSVTDIAKANGLNVDNFQRLLFAAKTLGLIEFTDLKTFSIVPNHKNFSSSGSNSLFWTVSSGLTARLAGASINQSKLVSEGFDEKQIELAISFKILQKNGDELSLTQDLEPLLNPSSPSYMGLWIRNYDRINSKIFTKANLIGAMQTGKTCWSATFGAQVTNPFDLAKVDPAIFADLMEGMHQSNITENEAIAKNLNLNEAKTILDIGGASGAWAMTLAKTFPSIEKISIYELDSAIPLYRAMYNRYKSTRDFPIEFIGGNFFSKTKDGNLLGLKAEDKFDIVTLGWIIHDWQDAEAVEILSKARSHLAVGGRIVMLEAILPEERTGKSTFLDLTMLVQTGGRERTLKDFEKISSAAGLMISNTLTTNARRQILELKVL